MAKTIFMSASYSYGLEIYEILDNGNLLHGVCSNMLKNRKELQPYEIDTEIARKDAKDPYYNNGIEGEYTSRYIETTPNPKIVTPCILKITKCGEVYEFEWRTPKDKVFFKGIGMKVGHSHIAVSYTNAKEFLK